MTSQKQRPKTAKTTAPRTSQPPRERAEWWRCPLLGYAERKGVYNIWGTRLTELSNTPMPPDPPALIKKRTQGLKNRMQNFTKGVPKKFPA